MSPVFSYSSHAELYLSHKTSDTSSLLIKWPAILHGPILTGISNWPTLWTLSRAVLSCWSSSAQSFLVSCTLGTHDHISVCPQDGLRVLKWGILFDEKRGLSFWVGATLVATYFRTGVPTVMKCSGKGICTLWAPHTFCNFTIMNGTYARYTQDICHCRLLQQILP
jgi:hypothetical protein